MGNYKLFLDDERFPAIGQNGWIIARSYDEAIAIMEEHRCPYYMSFDHDLGIDGAVEKNGKHVAEWMVERDLNSGNFFPDNFDFYVHSQNSVGADNIKSYLTNYLKFALKNKS